MAGGDFEHQLAYQRCEHAIGPDPTIETAGIENAGSDLDTDRAAQADLAGKAHMVAPFGGREHAFLGGLGFACPFAGHRHAAETAGAIAAASGRNRDAGAVQCPKQHIAAHRRNVLAAVQRDGGSALRHQPGAGRQQPDGQDQDQHGDDETSGDDLGHEATIWAKAEKPSDIMPAKMNAMPRPRSPAGRSA